MRTCTTLLQKIDGFCFMYSKYCMYFKRSPILLLPYACIIEKDRQEVIEIFGIVQSHLFNNFLLCHVMVNIVMRILESFHPCSVWHCFIISMDLKENILKDF
jgi:hypothetical protein